MTCEEIARREEWNRIMAWLKPPPSRIAATPQQRAANQRTFSLLRALRQRRCSAGERRIA
jgi:hypothetical protein